MDGTVRTVTEIDNDLFAVAVRWDDGTLSELPLSAAECPDVGERVSRND